MTTSSSATSSTALDMDTTSASNQPLMSLKDYRKQTKTFRSGCGRRRSSMMPPGQQSAQKGFAPGRDRSGLYVPTAKSGPNRGANVLGVIGETTTTTSVDEATRVSKLQEKIKVFLLE